MLALVNIPSPKFEPLACDPVTPDHWPTDGWQTSTPEEQGMGSDKLVDMMMFYKERRKKNELFRIDSLIIVRDGWFIADICPNPPYP